jgi:hypothetical protein
MSEINELDSTCGISDDELTERFKEAVRIEFLLPGMTQKNGLHI